MEGDFPKKAKRKEHRHPRKKWPPLVTIPLGIMCCLFSLGLGLPLLVLGGSGMAASFGWGGSLGTLLITRCDERSSRGASSCQGTFTPDDSTFLSPGEFLPSYTYGDPFDTAQPGDHIKVRVWPGSGPLATFVWTPGTFTWAFPLFFGLALPIVIWPFPAIRLIVLIRNLFQRTGRFKADHSHPAKRRGG